MRNILANMKTLVLFLTLAFTGHALAAPEYWFSGTASGTELGANGAEWDTDTYRGEGEVTIKASFLEIDLPTNAFVKLTPSSPADAGKRTYVVVDDAVFTPTFVDDIDNSVVVGSQTALTVAYDVNNNTNYYAYITNSWVKLTNLSPSPSAVDVTVVLDYSASTYTNVSFAVGSTTLQDAGGNYHFPITASTRSLDHIELAGYGKLHSITSLVETVNVSVVPKTVEYGADFTNATVTATVTSSVSDAEYYLTWNNGDRVKGTVTGDSGSGYVVTFADVPIVAPSSAYQSADYAITAEVGGSPFLTANASTKIADAKGWIDERAATTGKPAEAGGSWIPATVTYTNDIATITGVKTFTASNCSTGDLVKITFSNIVYAEVSDLTVETPPDTQGAFALAETNISNAVQTNFCVLTKQGDTYVWNAANCSGDVVVNTNIAYTVEMSFNYTNNTYSVSVSDGPHTGNLQVGEETEFAICDTEKTSVTAFTFKGNGTLQGIKGEEYAGYMAKAGTSWYVTIQQAIDSGNSGPFTILRPTGPAPEDWEFIFEDGMRKLKKIAKGLFFMAY